MMIEQTKRKLHSLRLMGMAQNFEGQLCSAATKDLAFEDRVGLMVDAEMTFRDNKRLKRLLHTAKLRENACIEDIKYLPNRGLNKAHIASLAKVEWVRQGVNLITTGPTGGGKTWMACAFGNQTCRYGLSVLFCRLPLLLEDLAIAHGDGTYRKRLSQLAKVDLLILDDLGITPLNPTGRGDLLEVLEQRCALRSTIITSQFPVSEWHGYLSGGNPTVADAILDRLVSGSERIEIGGESMRLQRKINKTSS